MLVCLHGLAVVCALQQTFTLCEIFLEGTLASTTVWKLIIAKTSHHGWLHIDDGIIVAKGDLVTSRPPEIFRWLRPWCMVTVHATNPPLFKQVQKGEYKEIELESVTLQNLSLVCINWQPNVFPLVFYCD